MSIYIYNTLTRKKEEFKPQNPPQVKMYTCGVTVYDDCHIGHARSLYVFEVIRSYLEYRGLEVKFVRNITDIDDKIISRAQQLNKDWKELAEEQITGYQNDLNLLGIRRGLLDAQDQEPRATKNIPEMIDYIKGLIDKGYAYVTDSGVYFSVRKFRDYGKLSGQSIDEILTGVRKGLDETKSDPLDFALWKISKPDEPYWISPWGKGRPGWHIECSVMSRKFLKSDTLDIHAGGRDLIFPHHENEVAQAEALTAKPFAKYWIHHGLLTINSQKMAKSAGNFLRLSDVIEKSADKELAMEGLKLFFLSACYGSPLDFTWEKLSDSEKQAKKINDFFQRAANLQNNEENTLTGLQTEVSKIKEQFIAAMDDDFNMPEGLAALFMLMDLGNHFVAQGNKSGVGQVKAVLEELLGIFTLRFKAAEDSRFNSLIKQRDSARAEGDFKKADEIRKELEQMGILLEDTKSGTIWRKK